MRKCGGGGLQASGGSRRAWWPRFPSDATENAVQANIVAAGYGTGSQRPW